MPEIQDAVPPAASNIPILILILILIPIVEIQHTVPPAVSKILILFVTKAGKRPRRTHKELEREAREICPEENPAVDFTSALRELKTK